MSITGLAIIYIIIWWIVFFAILPIDVVRQKTIKVDGEELLILSESDLLGTVSK